MQVLDESQVTQFLVAAHSSRYEALYDLAINTGMRQGELFGLKWSDLHWNSGILYVQQQIQNIPGRGKTFVEPKTKAERRSLKLGEGVLQKRREHQERQDLLKAFAGSRWRENDLIFPSIIGSLTSFSNCTQLHQFAPLNNKTCLHSRFNSHI